MLKEASGDAPTDAAATKTQSDDAASNGLPDESVARRSVRNRISPGTQLSQGRFEVLRCIGEGGMGVVYEVFDAARREKVALKTMSRMEGRDVYQFKNEFRALGDVSHPNLVRLYELSVENGLWYFTMELVHGERFDRWVRPVGEGGHRIKPDLDRLREAIQELVRGVTAIHSVGKLHRDLKPSNVLVTDGGRVIVLDFGLVIDPEIGGVGQTVLEDSLSGTPGYMAPEQAAGHPATTASDFYAVGVMLFEALTGRLPFEGTVNEIIAAKLRDEAPLASSRAKDVPERLDELCARLLARDPDARPDAREFYSLAPTLWGGAESGRSRESVTLRSPGRLRPSPQPSPPAPDLFGRDEELSLLRDAYRATLEGRAVVLIVSGESGIGKSALCEAFLHELRAEGRATVLSGRCYERENVPFKGFDSLVDDLSRHLRRQKSTEAAAVLPREVYALARLFPVLGRVDAVAEAPTKEVTDPLELRRRAYAAFGELLTRMRDRAPLCVHLDDVQWLDSDAVLFLRALLVQPDPPPGLLVLSHRSDGAQPTLLQVRDAIEGNSRLELRTISVGPLPPETACDLALELLSVKTSYAGPLAAAIGREAAGNPFFVAELCRYAARHGSDEGGLGSLSLSAALADRLQSLPATALRLLELSALAGKPFPAELLMRAARATHAELDELRTAHLLRLSRIDDSPLVECYHDKVRELVAQGLTEPTRVDCFAALARALEEASHSDPELLGTCLEGAGQRQRAAGLCAVAAEQAMASAAFLHAAELFERALSLGAFPPERQHQLRVANADALAAAGRGKQAAGVYLRAAEDAQGLVKSDLRRRAAGQLLTTGHTEEGTALFRALFAEYGLTLPSSAGAALGRLLISQPRLRLRGLKHVRRRAEECSAETLRSLTVQAEAVPGLCMHASPLIAASVCNDYLLRALATGEPQHLVTALAFSAWVQSLVEPAAAERITAMMDMAQEIVSELDAASLNRWAEGMLGASYANRGLYARARGHLTVSLQPAADGRVEGKPILDMDGFLYFEQLANFYSGEWQRIARTAPSRIEQGMSRDRIWVSVALSGYCGTVAWLSGDDVAGYERVLTNAKARWKRGKEPHWPDYFLAMGEVMLLLYRKDPLSAHRSFEATWTWLSRSLMNRAQGHNAMSLFYRGTALLASLRATGQGVDLAVARDAFKRLERSQVPEGAPFRNILGAGLALYSANVDRAAEHLSAAIAGFDANDLRMWGAATRRRLGQLRGGDEGARLLAAGDAVMRAQGVVDLEAMTEMLCAGCRAPE